MRSPEAVGRFFCMNPGLRSGPRCPKGCHDSARSPWLPGWPWNVNSPHPSVRTAILDLPWGAGAGLVRPGAHQPGIVFCARIADYPKPWFRYVPLTPALQPQADEAGLGHRHRRHAHLPLPTRTRAAPVPPVPLARSSWMSGSGDADAARPGLGHGRKTSSLACAC